MSKSSSPEQDAPSLEDAVTRAEPMAARKLTPEALRALAEADERRRLAHEAQARPPEVGGRGGLEPTRYGDWEKDGIVSDF